MSAIPTRLRRLFVQRAADRCETCGLAQAGQEVTFHIDHILPVTAGGMTIAENLALACVSCSLRKGARQRGVDPQTDQEAAIYHPRQDDWHAHFQWEGVMLIGLTPTGRATIAALEMNRPLIVAIRHKEELLGRHSTAEITGSDTI